MNPESYQFLPYEQIPELTLEASVSKLKSGQYLKYYDLIIDVTGFKHPGHNRLIASNFGKDITQLFNVQGHSANANLLICSRVIAKTSETSSLSKEFYNKTIKSKKNQLHMYTLSKINFSLPLIDEINKLSPQQLKILTQIPKDFQQPQKIKFTSSTFSEWLYVRNFWFSSLCFQTVLLALIIYLLKSFSSSQIIKHLHYIFFGVLKWTLIEYFFHRTLFHYDLNKRRHLRSHYMHHAFPNMANNVAVPAVSTLVQLGVIYAGYNLFLCDLSTLMLIIGLLAALTFYDIIHYYCHFGYQTNIKWLNYLRTYHLKHHYRNEDRNFGVTSPIWDIVFGTYDCKKSV